MQFTVYNGQVKDRGLPPGSGGKWNLEAGKNTFVFSNVVIESGMSQPAENILALKRNSIKFFEDAEINQSGKLTVKSIEAADGKFTVNANGGVNVGNGKFVVNPNNGSFTASGGNFTSDAQGHIEANSIAVDEGEFNNLISDQLNVAGKFVVNNYGALTVNHPSDYAVDVTGTVKANKFVGLNGEITSIQWQNVSNNTEINYNGNVGIGTNNPEAKLDVVGTSILFRGNNGNTLRFLTNNPGVEVGASTGKLTFWYTGVGYNKIESGDINIKNGENSTISSSQHNLYFTGEPGTYADKYYKFRPAWGTAVATFTTLELETADNQGAYDSKVRLHSAGDSYFAGGRVGIGTTTPSAKLEVKHTANITANQTSYDIGIRSNFIDYTIPVNLIDNGYKISIEARAYSNNNEFAGTLNQSIGVWARAGMFNGASSAVIKEAIAVSAEVLDNVQDARIDDVYGVKIQTNNYNKTTVTNRYDLYAGTVTAKNYFAGRVGIGTTSPQSTLDIATTNQRIQFLTGTCSSEYTMQVGLSDNGINFTNTSEIRGYNFNNANGNLMKITADGKVGIGNPDISHNPTATLDVNGNIRTNEVLINLDNWRDVVFSKEYALMPLNELEQFIKTNGHLPEIPSESEILKNGMSTGAMATLQMGKIEELTLYTIEQQKQIDAQQKQIETLLRELNALKQTINTGKHE